MMVKYGIFFSFFILMVKRNAPKALKTLCLVIDYVAKKFGSGSYAINTVKKYLSVRNLKSLYYSFVHSYISYYAMIVLWSSANKSFIHCLDLHTDFHTKYRLYGSMKNVMTLISL